MEKDASCEGNLEKTLPKLQLPLAKIKKISKKDPALHSISAEAVYLATLGAEKYVQLLARAAFDYAKRENRKTVQMKDIDRCVKKDLLFAILEDAIEDWPEGQARMLMSNISALPQQESSSNQVAADVFDEEMEMDVDVDRLIDRRSFQRNQLNIEKHNYREKINSNAINYSAEHLPESSQEDLELLLGEEYELELTELVEEPRLLRKEDFLQDEILASDQTEESQALTQPAVNVPDIEDMA